MGDATAAVGSAREEDVSSGDNTTVEVVGATGDDGSTGDAGEETIVVFGT